MDTSASAFFGLVRETLSEPRATARRIIATDVPMSVRWQALALVVVVSVILAKLTMLMLGTPSGVMPGMAAGPIWAAVLQTGVLLLVAGAADRVGRMMGGHGDFADALLLVVWLQAIMLLIQAAQIVALLLLPPFAGLIGLAAMVLFLWLLTNFVAELHGFDSLGKVFGMIVVTAVGLAFLLATVLAVFGIGPPEVG